MDYSILKGFIIAFLIQHSTSEDLSSSLQSSAISLQDESQALSQEQEPVGAEVVPAVGPPSLQEVQKAVQEASEKEGQGAEEVLKGLLERVVEAALGAAESASEPKVEDPMAVTVEGAAAVKEGQTGQAEEEGQVVEDTGLEQELVDALEVGADRVEGNSKTIIAESNEQETNEEVADVVNNMEQTSDTPVDKESAAEMVVGAELVQEVVDLSPDLADVEQESVIEKVEDVIDIAQNIAGEALEQALDTNRLLDNEMHTGAVEGNLIVQEVDTEQLSVEAEEMGDGETVIEAGSIVPNVAEGSEAGEEAASEEANNSKDHDQEVHQVSDGESQDGAAGVQEEGLVLQNPEQLPESPPPSPAQSGAEGNASTPGNERANHGNESLSPDQAQVEPALENAVNDELVLPPKLEGEQLGETNELVEDPTKNGETSELGLEAWKIGAICAAVILVLETVVIIIYILRNRNKNSSSQRRACEEGSVEPEAATGGDYNDDTLPAGNGDTQQTRILDPSKVASTLLQNKDEQEAELVIPMSELAPSSAEDRSNTGEPEPSPERRTSTL